MNDFNTAYLIIKARTVAGGYREAGRLAKAATLSRLADRLESILLMKRQLLSSDSARHCIKWGLS